MIWKSLAFGFLLIGAAAAWQDHHDRLRQHLLRLFDKSVAECAGQAREERCVKVQFGLNYGFYVLHRCPSCGPPGVSGGRSNYFR